MKLNDLKKAAAKARQDLQFAERKAGDLQRKAKAAKAKSEQTRLEHKRARKSAKQAKKQTRVLEKVQKRLAKALKKVGQGKGKQKSKPARPPAPPKQVPKKHPAIAPKTQMTAAGRPAPSAAAVSVTPPPVVPTV
jgi:hypothetical protein